MNCNQEKIKKKMGRPKGLKRSPSEQRTYLRERSRIYYSNPDNKNKQRIKMRIYMVKNKNKNKKTKYPRLTKIQKEKLTLLLKKIWISRGLFQ